MDVHFHFDESAGDLGFCVESIQNFFLSVDRCEKGKEIVQIWWGYLLLHYVEYEHLGWGHSWNKGHLRQAKQACGLISGNPLPA